MRLSKCSWLCVFCLMVISLFTNQVLSQKGIERNFERVELHVDTMIYTWGEDKIMVQDEPRLPFQYTQKSPVLEFRFYPKKNVELHFIHPSTQYTIIDSLLLIEDDYYRVRIRVSEIVRTTQLSLTLGVQSGIQSSNSSIPLLPYTATHATMYPGEGDLFVGEEKVFEIVTNRPENLKIDERWKKEEAYEYRFFKEDDKVYYSVIPNKLGELTVALNVDLFQPFRTENNNVIYKLPVQTFKLNVKGSRLSFLRFDERELIWERDNREGVEIQLENHRLLELNKTYRIEASDEAGSPLIAEIFTLKRLSNDNVLCMFRPYNYHRSSDSYLFVKDGDKPMFITNINILPEPKIDQVSMLRKGGTWVNSTKIYPGETVEIRLEGESLSRTEFVFQGLRDISMDSIIRNDKVAHFLVTVPLDIRQKSVPIYNRDRKTGVSLDIQELNRPRELDFVVVEYGSTPKRLIEINQPILHNGTIGDVTLDFEAFNVDEKNELYGKQFLEVEIKLKDDRNMLVERYVIDDIVICPGRGSPRYFNYVENNDCSNTHFSVNDYLSNKTHSMNNWAKVEITVRHRKGKYSGSGYTERIEIIKEKLVVFDVDISIPAGLLIKKVGVDGFPGLSGVSLSMLGQFSFYQKGEIQRLRPYKIGAGFLAKNAFNFNPEAERDLGIVILGSVYPSKKERKISFPLYAGFGYFLNEEKFFYLIGPGVRINF